jgi:hypothetical protein
MPNIALIMLNACNVIERRQHSDPPTRVGVEERSHTQIMLVAVSTTFYASRSGFTPDTDR